MVIDFHTHIFPDKIAERAIDTLENNILKIQGRRYDAVIGARIADLKQSMKRNGVDECLVLPIATTLTQWHTINEFAQSINNKDGIYSLGSLHPFQDNWEEALYDIKEKGLRGIKLHPEYQDFYVDCPESLRLLKKCEELDLIVVLHAGNDVGAPPPAHCLPDRLHHTLRYVSGEKIVAAHMGGWAAWDEVEKYLVGTPLYFDTAYTLSHIKEEQLMRIIRNHGSEKILFGTDSPWQKQGETIEQFEALDLTKEEKDNIFYKNAKKLLQI